jgi:hypothetical protein
MDLYFASAEQPQYLNLLESLGVKHVSISYYEWERRHSGIAGVEALRKFVPEGISIILTPGIAKKEGLDYHAFSRSYIEFCERNAEDALIYDLDSQDCPIQVRRETRKHLTFFPHLVVFPMEDESHKDLAGTYERIGINANAAKSIPTAELRRLPATLYGSNITNPKVLGGARFAATTSMAWLSGRRYGELWLFLRGQLRHFPAEQLQRACRAYKDDITAVGGDPDACAAANKDAITFVGVKSLLLMSDSLSGRLRDRVKDDTSVILPKGHLLEPHVDSGTTSATPGALVPTERIRVQLPVLQGERANQQSLRMCDSCDLSSVCPKYEASASCAFDIPLEIKTDADWEKACQVILEWQFGRIAFSVFAEQVNGGQPLPKTGQEMDRFTKLLTSVKELKKPDIANVGVLGELLSGVKPPPSESEHGTEEEDTEDAEVIEEDTTAT